MFERRRAGLERKNETFFIFFFQEVRKYDSGMLADSGVYNELARNSFDTAGNPFVAIWRPGLPTESPSLSFLQKCSSYTTDGRF